MPTRRRPTIAGVTVLVAACVLLLPATVRAQLGQLASPGPLSRAHGSLEGADKCTSCHEPGRQVTASKCLACHKPIADRIAARRGVHKDVTTECVTCHAEHNGVDAELRPFDTRAFDHAAVARFALDGKHAGLACSRCHKARSFVTLSPSCASCHADVHRGSLGANCSACHSTSTAFKEASRSFDHGRAAFPLTGRHEQLACSACHVKGQFKGLRFDTCASCHTDPHRKQFGPSCTTCHTTERWATEQVDHSKTAFPLVGLHKTVPCARCHVQSPMKSRVKFARCSDCHADPHNGRFKEDCRSCHTESGFSTSGTFDHLARTGFALTGKHGGLACAKCHTGILPAVPGRKTRTVDFSGARKDCASCHADPHKGAAGPQCTTCHDTASFHVTTYAHPRTPEFFAGPHASVTCAQCHARAPTAPVRTGLSAGLMTFKGTPTACASCHADAHLGQLGSACETCHRVEHGRFTAATFDHSRASFPLTGRHQQVACEACHKKETGAFPAGSGTATRFKGVATACASCHKDPHLGQVGVRCERCHTTATFAVKQFNHVGFEGFFVGRHATLECVQCHKREEGTFAGGQGVAVRYRVGTDCSSCHKDSHNGALGANCGACHTPVLWNDPNRAFHKVTVFPLTGKHLAVPCASCHVKGALKGTPTQCYDCHWVRRQDDFYKLRLGMQCADCHRTTSWTAVTWDHAARTGLALNLAHRLLACDTCHKDRTFAATRPDCIDCHQEDYRQAKNPDHVAAGFPFSCDLCHSPAAPTFSGARFVHSSFILRGAHALQPCAACHGNGIYQGTSHACVSCHLADYQRTTNPNHAAAGFPTACESCHTDNSTGWTTATFNHAQFFALSGAHGTAACSACHKNGVFQGTPTECYSCHKTDYQHTANPNHATAGFPTTCEQCHRSGGPGWTATSFDHNQFFVLSGRHATAACTDCHKNGTYTGTPKDCYSCHQVDYQHTTDPNHVSAGFPTACDQCHRSGGPGWTGASFNHSQFYALVGVHATQPCAACHRNGVYAGTPNTCVGCHLAQYKSTNNPNHAAAGFPTTCDSCHRPTDTSWLQGRFDHTWFPITSGPHAGNTCSACHTNSSNYAVFTCLTCHGRATTDSHHTGVAGYRYDSNACYSCHPTGRSE